MQGIHKPREGIEKILRSWELGSMTTNNKMLDNLNEIGRLHLKNVKLLGRQAHRFWKRHGKRDASGSLTITDDRLVKEAMRIQQEIDTENHAALRSLFSSRIVWQGWA
jgi:hypothetical protein